MDTPCLPPAGDCSTIEAARLSGVAVRSVQTMADRGDLQAWETPGGHRRISRASVDRCLAARGGPAPAPEAAGAPLRAAAPVVVDPPPRRGLCVLLVDLVLPGIDSSTLITSLRSHPQFQRSRLIVLTTLDDAQRAPHAFALRGVTVVHKTRLVDELPALLAACAARVPERPRRGA